jgi:uncharacterized protein YjbI with pentapeptide repeats
MNEAAPLVRTNPFPGLRPFREDEEYLFFGRESQVDAMVDKLAATRFLAVVGTSGSGKSSLVNCGLRPALRQGLMAPAGVAWRMAQFRPGTDPIGAMARALAQDGVLFPPDAAQGLPRAEIVETTLRISKLGLIDIFEQARLEEGVNLLVVVDQFEELFRYRQLETARGDQRVNEDVAAFVNLLLEVKQQKTYPIFVVLTMRSDFLGDCAQLPGLAEAINAGQYLVPRLTRDERRAAIEGPVRVGGAEIAPVLLTRLVNDVGDNPDQLSILQHALNRTWARWQNEGGGKGPLDLAHYESIGTMAHALDRHAERAYSELDNPRQQQICEKLFRALTDKATDSRGTRRPTTLGALCALTDATAAEVTAVIDVFRKPSRSFLMPAAGEALKGETMIDISHESLMRVWQRLNSWADEEAQSARTYRRLAETADLHASGAASLWRDPDLQLALDWRDNCHPNESWASRYHPGFAPAMDFLTRSSDAREAERTERQRQRERELVAEQEKAKAQAKQRKQKVVAMSAVGIALCLVGIVYVHLTEQRWIDSRIVELKKLSLNQNQLRQKLTEEFVSERKNGEINDKKKILDDQMSSELRYIRLLQNFGPADIDLSATKISDLDLHDAVLNNLRLISSHIDNIDFSSTTDQPRNLVSSVFSDSDIKNSSFNKSNLSHSQFRDATLKNVNFLGSNLYRAAFDRATLTNVDFSGSSVRLATFWNAVLDENTYLSLTATEWWLAKGWTPKMIDELVGLQQSQPMKYDEFSAKQRKQLDDLLNPIVGETPIKDSVIEEVERAHTKLKEANSTGDTFTRAIALGDWAWTLAVHLGVPPSDARQAELGMDCDPADLIPKTAEKAAQQALCLLDKVSADETAGKGLGAEDEKKPDPYKLNFEDTLGYILLQKKNVNGALDYLDKGASGGATDALFRLGVAKKASAISKEENGDYCGALRQLQDARKNVEQAIGKGNYVPTHERFRLREYLGHGNFLAEIDEAANRLRTTAADCR